MSSLTKKERKFKFNKLSNDLNIKLIKRTKHSFLYMKDYINNGGNFNKNPIDLSLKSRKTASCHELPFEILSLYYMNTISSDVEINEYKLLGTESNKIS